MGKVFHRILVTGATGFLGSHIVPVLQEKTSAEIVPVGRADFDLLSPEEPGRMLRDVKPDAVLHLAAKVGGIIANRDYPAEFFRENILINTNTLHACFEAGIEKFVTFIGGCSYPGAAASPISEDQMWNGIPQGESAPYSVAKKMMLIQSDSYRAQYGFDSLVLIPGNVYGEHDNFNEGYSHVIPALIRRFIEAKESGAPEIDCYGSGLPTRDFVYAGDVATLVPWFLESYDGHDPVNISSGTRTSIKDLAELVRQETAYPGEIRWDTSKPDGQIDKIFDVKRLHALGLSCDTSLEDGVRRTVEWFTEALAQEQVRL